MPPAVTFAALAVLVSAKAAMLTPTHGHVKSTQTISATDPRVTWSGRVSRNTPAGPGSVRFDWLGVTARIRVSKATYVSVKASGGDASRGMMRGTRLRSWVSDQGWSRFPMTETWVSPDPNFADTLIFTNNYADPQSRLITLSNLVPPQYQTGITTVLSFETDGVFETAFPQTRRIEFVGDSITAATNVVRPAGVQRCGDSGYQSDWSLSYSGLLCGAFNASCSTIAVGGKCMLRECGGLQMPDYYGSLFYDDAPNRTFDFKSWVPDAIVINLGTNDMRVIGDPSSSLGAKFTSDTVQFMKNATQLYNKPEIQFFLTTGPMENTTAPLTKQAIENANAQGIRATLIDMSTACVDAVQHAPGDSDGCDGCANHPGIFGHRGMYEAARPVIEKVMGWTPEQQ